MDASPLVGLALDGWDEADDYEEAFDLEDEDGFDLDEDALDLFDPFDDDELDEDPFEYDAAAGLYLPRLPMGPGAGGLVIAHSLEPFLDDAMDSDDIDAFFKKLWRGIKRVGKGVWRGVKKVGKFVAPVLKKALPVIQKVAGFAGPWGRLISGGIGAVQGLMSGKGLRGALAGALGGAIPGIGGRLASAVLGYDGADDDAAMDALADMVDARRIPGTYALPIGAALAARTAARMGVARGRPLAGLARAALWRRAQSARKGFLKAATTMAGPVGRRIRAMRSMARLAGARLRQKAPAKAHRALPQVARAASRTVDRRIGADPHQGASTRRQAQRRIVLRRRVLIQTPVAVIVSR